MTLTWLPVPALGLVFLGLSQHECDCGLKTAAAKSSIVNVLGIEGGFETAQGCPYSKSYRKFNHFLV